MNNFNKLDKYSELKEIYNDEIDLKSLSKSLLRRKNIIALITSASTLLSIIYTSSQKSIYSGSFEIFVDKKTNSSQAQSQITANLKLINKNNISNSKTQEFILKSPSVLLPVYSQTQKLYLERGDKKQKYKQWIRKNLNIKFIKDTDIISVTFKDKNKELILNTLNLISETYINFSTKKQKKEISSSIKYLDNQVNNYEKIALNSQKEFNTFSIENGLGNIDGFVELESPKNRNYSMLDNLSPNNDIEINLRNSRPRSMQRYSKQFTTLENYESQYADLSSKLKPNSKLLNELKIRIENLRTSLKRPNEIIVKYNSLATKYLRHESILTDLKNKLALYKLEKAKESTPWEEISSPTVDSIRIFPKRKKNALSAFLFSLFGSSLLAYIIDKKSRFVYDLKDLKPILKIDLLGKIYLENKTLSKKLIKRIFESQNSSNQKNKKLEKNYLVNINTSNLEDLDYFNNSRNAQNEFEIISFEDFKKLDKFQTVIFIIKEGNISKAEVLLINEYSYLYREQIIGWMILDYTKF